MNEYIRNDVENTDHIVLVLLLLVQPIIFGKFKFNFHFLGK